MAETLPAQRVGSSVDVPDSPVPATYYRYDYRSGSNYRLRTSRGGSDYVRDDVPGESGPGRVHRAANWIGGHSGQSVHYVNVPRGVPRFLGNRNILFMAWIIAMVLIGADEWKSHHIFPRPLRLWSATVVYGILFLLSAIDGLVPLVNALAIGFDFALGWEYYNGGISKTSTASSQSLGNNFQQVNSSIGSILNAGQLGTVSPGVVQGQQVGQAAQQSLKQFGANTHGGVQ